MKISGGHFSQAGVFQLFLIRSCWLERGARSFFSKEAKQKKMKKEEKHLIQFDTSTCSPSLLYCIPICPD